MSVGQNIKLKRKEKNITAAQLAEMVGVKQSTIARYENGYVRHISDDRLLKISNALDCPVSVLIGDDSKYVPSKKKRFSAKTLSQEEQDIIVKYRELPAVAQNIVKEICNLEIVVNN